MRPLTLSIALALAIAAGPARSETVTVFAAASTRTALDVIARDFAEAKEHDAVISYAGSSALARQIERGAPAGIFISANPDWMDLLEAGGAIAPGTRRDLLGNRLVLVGREGAPVEITPALDLVSLLEGGHLAMALVDAVPAGIYGKAALTSLGQWDAVAPQVAQADNVRAALALVSTGAARLGVVYATDAAADPGVQVLGTFPEDSHPPIVYPVAGIAGETGAAETAFLDFLGGAAARAAFEAQGFRVTDP